VTSVLGGKATGALNALVLVRASGGGQCPYAQRLPIHSSLFSCSTVVSARPLSGSLDVFSVFEAAALDDHMAYQNVELRASICARVTSLCASVRVPLTDTLDNSPRVSIRALALEWRLYFAVEFPWVRASDPAGVALEPLEEFFDSFKGCIA